MKKFSIRNDRLSVLLLGVSAVFGIIVAGKLVAFSVTYVRTDMLAEKAMMQSSIDPNETEKIFARSKELADEVKKKNLFLPPAPKQHPVSQVAGILGDEVLINGKFYKVGEKIGDAEIMAIEPTQVKIKWDGKETYFAPIAAANASEPERKKKKPAVKNTDNGKKKRLPRNRRGKEFRQRHKRRTRLPG